MSTGAPPIRVAFCITELDPGGAERALYELVTRLDRSEWTPHVFCLAGPGPLVEAFQTAGVPVTCLGARYWWNVGVVRRLSRALRSFAPQLLQTYLFHANLVGRLAGKWAHVPVIVSGIRVAERRSRFRLQLDRLTEDLVDRHVCVSRAVAQFSTECGGLSPDKTVVIPNGVDVERFAAAEPARLSEFGIPPDAQTVLFVGRLDSQKDPFVLLEAAKGLSSTYDKLHVLMVGDGPLRAKILDWIHRSNLQFRIHIAGYRNDIPQLMRASDCLVLPSRWEGLPNVVLEAMAAGLPVIVSDVDGAGELVRNHQTGLLVPPASPRELAGAMALLLNDAEQTRMMGKASQSFVSKHFTWDATVSAHQDLYHKLLQEASSARV